MAGSRRKPVDAKLTRRQTDKCRAAIQVSLLVNRLTDHAMGKIDLSPAQVTSIKVLLGKAMPDLSATEITDMTPDFGNPVDIEKQYQELVESAAMDMVQRMTPEQIAKLGAKHWGRDMKKPQPNMLGTGAASKAAKALKERHKRIKEAINGKQRKTRNVFED